MVRSGEDLSSLKSGLRRYPQTLINIAVPSDFQLDECAEALQESERVESLLEGRGRLLLRASGTEPLIRIMIEGTDASENQQLAEGIAEAIRAAC